MAPQEVFLRGLWRMVPDEEDTGWVSRVAAQAASNEPLGDLPKLVQEMRDAGLEDAKIARFAKLMAYETAFGMLYHLEDPNASYTGAEPDEKRLEWELYLRDQETGKPTEPLNALHEFFLSMDPTGREMRPKPSN